MTIAALPGYLQGLDYKSASPGMRFGMYLSLWTTSFKKETDKVEPLKRAGKLNDSDIKLMKQLLDRQKSAFDADGVNDGRFALDALAIAPFTTGLGNEHPLENGFAFFNPYGLPYLPGSGVKGVLRQAARELACGDWGDSSGWSNQKIYLLEAGKERIPLSADVIPQIKGDSLAVDIMTPHQGHYYQQKLDAKTGNSISPHDSGQPVPISFLTVPPDSGFSFHVQCDLEHLARTAPDLVKEGQWKALLIAAFEQAFTWLGFGAKTAVGYGQMKTTALKEERVQRLEAAGIRVASTRWERARLAATDPGPGNITVEGPDGKKVTGKFYSQLSDAAKKQFKNKKAVLLNVEVEEKGNFFEIKSIEEVQQ